MPRIGRKNAAKKRKRQTKDSSSNNETFYVEEIIQNYPIKATCHAEVELYRVSWHDYGKSHDSYEPAVEIFEDVPLVIKKYWERKVTDKKVTDKKVKDEKMKDNKEKDTKDSIKDKVTFDRKSLRNEKLKKSNKQ